MRPKTMTKTEPTSEEGTDAEKYADDNRHPNEPSVFLALTEQTGERITVRLSTADYDRLQRLKAREGLTTDTDGVREAIRAADGGQA